MNLSNPDINPKEEALVEMTEIAQTTGQYDTAFDLDKYNETKKVIRAEQQEVLPKNRFRKGLRL